MEIQPSSDSRSSLSPDSVPTFGTIKSEDMKSSPSADVMNENPKKSDEIESPSGTTQARRILGRKRAPTLWETILGGNVIIPTPVAIIIGLAIFGANIGYSMGNPVDGSSPGLPGYRPLSNFSDYHDIPHQDFLMQYFENLNNGNGAGQCTRNQNFHLSAG